MKPLFSYAIDNAILAIGRHSPVRSDGGYGEFPKTFVALKTAGRLVDLGYAVAIPKFAGRNSRLELTESGRVAFGDLERHIAGQQPPAAPETFPCSAGDGSIRRVRSPNWRECRGAPGNYRVVSWEFHPDGRTSEVWRDEHDYSELAAAKARAGELAAIGNRAVVFNDKGRKMHVAYEPGAGVNYAATLPVAVTRLARTSGEEPKPRAGTHRRK